MSILIYSSTFKVFEYFGSIEYFEKFLLEYKYMLQIVLDYKYKVQAGYYVLEYFPSSGWKCVKFLSMIIMADASYGGFRNIMKR